MARERKEMDEERKRLTEERLSFEEERAEFANERNKWMDKIVVLETELASKSVVGYCVNIVRDNYAFLMYLSFE